MSGVDMSIYVLSQPGVDMSLYIGIVFITNIIEC